MRRYLLLLALALPAAGILATGPPCETLAAQTADDPVPDEDEPGAPEKLGKLTLTLDAGAHTANIARVLFTSDSKQLITCGLDNIRIWDADTGAARKVLHLPGIYVAAVTTLSPDGKTLAVVSRARRGNVPFRIYLLATGDWQIQRTFDIPASELALEENFTPVLAFSADGRQLAAAREIIRIWDLSQAGDQPTRVFKRKAAVQGLAFSPDGSQLVEVLNGSAGIRDLATGKGKALKDAGSIRPSWRFGLVAWSPDGKTIAAGGSDGLRLYEPDGTLRTHRFKEKAVHSVSFSPDSRRLLTTGAHGVRVFNVATATKEVNFPRKESGIGFQVMPTGALSADGKLGAATVRDNAYIWNASDGGLLHRLSAGAWLFPDASQASWNADGSAASWAKLVLGKGAPGKGALDKSALGKQAHTFNFLNLQFDPPKGTRHGVVVQQGPLSVKLVNEQRKVQVLKEGKLLSEFKLPLPFVMPTTPNQVTLVGPERVALAAFPAVFLLEAQTGKVVARLGLPDGFSMAPSPDGRFLLTLSPATQRLRIWEAREGKLLLTLYTKGQDWIVWTPQGYYAATPGGERLMGWTLDDGMDKLPNYYPADRFRKQLYRPDVIKLLLEKGNLEDALETANAILRKEGTIVPVGIADPNKLLPPRAFLHILDKKDLPTIKVKASAVAAVPNQPVTALRLLLNGRPLPDKAGYTVGKSEDVWDITLPPGKHHLAVLARSADASSVSNSIEVEVAAPGKPSVMHVLAIGINDYEDKTLKLDFAAKDAQDLFDTFKKTCKGELFREVRGAPLLNAKARRDTILEELADLRKKVNPNDLLVVFFAGHGVKDKDKFYLLTVEARTNDLARTAISGEDLRKSLGEFPCQVLLMLDACHSSGGIKNFRPAVDDITRNLTDDECGVAVLCAAMAHEKALEKSGNGLFTRAVVQALHGGKNVPFNHRNQRLYVHHLHGFVLDEVSALSNDQQHPFLSLPWVVESFPVAQFAANAKP